MVVKQGVDNLSPMDDDEFDRVEQASDFQLNSRLGCQAIVQGDVTVSIPAWNRNYISEGGASILGDGIPAPKKAQPQFASAPLPSQVPSRLMRL